MNPKITLPRQFFPPVSAQAPALSYSPPIAALPQSFISEQLAHKEITTLTSHNQSIRHATLAPTASIPLIAGDPEKKPTQIQDTSNKLDKPSPLSSVNLDDDSEFSGHAYLNALFVELAKITNITTPFFLNPSSGKMFILKPSQETPDNIYRHFLTQVIGIDNETLGPNLTKEQMAIYKDAIPDSISEIMSTIYELSQRYGMEVVFTEAKGHFFGFNFDQLDDDTDPLDIILHKYFNHPAPTTSQTDDENAQTNSTSPAEDSKTKNDVPHLRAVPDIEYTVADIIEPYSSVFLKREVLNQALRSIGLKQLIKHRNENILDLIKKNEVSFPNGMILTGPPGTGKSALMEANLEAYKRLGSPTKEISLESLEDKYVGSFGKNLVTIMDQLVKEAKEAGKPALLAIDEGDNLATRVSSSSESRRYYQAALNAIKRYSTKYPELVIMISTNANSKDLDPALTRSKRLAVIHVDIPTDEVRAKIFEYYLKEFDILDGLTNQQLRKLAIALPSSQGADIRSFCESYIQQLINDEHHKAGRRTVLDEIQYLFVEQSGKDFNTDDIKHLITFDRVYADLKKFAESQRAKVSGRRRIGLA